MGDLYTHIHPPTPTHTGHDLHCSLWVKVSPSSSGDVVTTPVLLPIFKEGILCFSFHRLADQNRVEVR